MPGAVAERVWSIARKLTDYPKFMDQVLRVEACEFEGADSATSWVVLLNGNELRWIEADEYDENARRMTFRQLDGDLAEWNGSFQAISDPHGVIAKYDVNFDLGIPALANILHPLGEAAIRANCTQMLEELERRSRNAQQADA
ncbi:MAG: SRPBCC family protein [Phenylobacterium sp.]|nr:SRPBCC family protein [Phenylobacterium sp.]MDP3745626.1 SRPBCC family protein [Phenylobacterium sp.]